VELWQLPLGKTRPNDTWGHYRDNRLQWWSDGGFFYRLARRYEAHRLARASVATSSSRGADIDSGSEWMSARSDWKARV
jgi:hypothetical protein